MQLINAMLMTALILGGSAHATDKCVYTPPAADAVRPGKTIRLGGYFYAGALDVNWYAANYDLLSLNAKNDPDTIARLKGINPSIIVFQQFLANQITIKQTGAQAVEGYDLSKMANWLLRTPDGTPATPRGPFYLMVDHSSASGWAEHFSKYVVGALSATGADGVNLDEIPLRRTGMFSNLVKYQNDADLQAATSSFLGSIRIAIKKPVMINVGELSAKSPTGETLWNTIGRQIDGAWHEGWVRFYGAHTQPHDGSNWEWDIASAERFSEEGKPYIASAAFANTAELEYAIANYLLAIKGRTLVFQPMVAYDPKTRGGFNFAIAQQAVEANRPLFDVDIGCPVATRQVTNGVWSRRYSKGLVIVNPEKTPRTFQVGSSNYRDVNGQMVPATLAIGAFEGRILLLSRN